MKHRQPNMYPKVKVREQSEEGDDYNYGRSSMQSLKAFEWLSLDHLSSSDERDPSVVRIPCSYNPKSSRPGFLASKAEETNKNKKADKGENRKNVRAASALRPRAVVSSSANDAIVGSKDRTTRDLLSPLKRHDLCQNRHTKCMIFPKPEPIGSKNCVRATGRTTTADSSTKGKG